MRYDVDRGGTMLQLYLDDGNPVADFELLISGAPVDETMLIGVSAMDAGLL